MLTRETFGEKTHRLLKRLGVACLVLALAIAAGGESRACPLCTAPELTMAEQYASADSAMLLKWKSGIEGTKDKAGSTTFEIVQVLRDPLKMQQVGEEYKLERFRAGKPGDLTLMLGVKSGGKLDWTPLDVSEAMFKYITTAPTPDLPIQDRLRFFMDYLEHPDEPIAADAYGEFAKAAYKDIVAIKSDMPHDRLKELVANPQTASTRVGLYGMMLGLCGTEEDKTVFEQKILVKTTDFRLGIDGVIAGYLILLGEAGLPVIEKEKLLAKEIPFAETFAAVQALKFMWSYGDNRISQPRLKASMRLLIERPEMVDLIIPDLARWKDWSVQDRLMELYGEGDYNAPAVRRSIIRYMFTSVKDVPSGSSETAAHVTKGKKYLDELRARDGKLVRDVERYSIQ